MSAQQFVLEIGRAMHALGSPSYRVEDTMDACCHALGLQGSFFSTPTAIFAAVGERGAEAKTTLMRVQPGDHDLGRLAELYTIRDAVVRGGLPPAEGLARIAAVLAAPARRRRLLLPLACGLAGAAAGVLFGRGVLEAGFAGIAGMVVGLLALLARLRPGFADVLAPLACALVAFAANVAAASGIRIDPVITTLAAIVVLLPGLSFTTALAELAMRHLSSGSARLLGAVAVLATMAVGVTIGDRCARAIVGWAPAVNPERLGVAWHLLALAATWLAYVILLGAVKKQAGWILLAVAIGFGGSWFGSRVLEGEDGAFVGAFVGALAVSFTANLCARWRRLPAAVVRTPGLLLLVPGSLGFRGLTSAAIPTATASAPLILQMLLVGGSIVAGMLIAGVLLPPPLDVEPDSRRRIEPL